MFGILLALHIIVCIMLVIAVLMQSSKGGGLAGTFGGTSTAFLSGRQAADTLTKATVVLAILFALLSIGLNVTYVRDGEDEKGLIEGQLEEGGAPSLPGQ